VGLASLIEGFGSNVATPGSLGRGSSEAGGSVTSSVGASVGSSVGSSVGASVTSALGSGVGFFVGLGLGLSDGDGSGVGVAALAGTWAERVVVPETHVCVSPLLVVVLTVMVYVPALGTLRTVGGMIGFGGFTDP
jgi:hypothetical protein